jgi:hypothetical protein
MAEPHVVSALRTKRAEFSGYIADLERKINRQRAELAHVDATIRLFSPGANPDTILPKRPYRRTRYFARNELVPAYARRSADGIKAAHVSWNSCPRYAGEGNAVRRCGYQGNRHGAGAYRVAAAHEARGGGEDRD